MSDRSWRWTDAHFCSLPSQTNIYGYTKIVGSDGINKLLVASLVGRIFTIEYQRIFDKLTPFTREVQFTYIPGESEIISVDAINRCCHGQRLIIGITFWKLEEGESKQFFNIYSASQAGEEFNLESVSQGCQSMELGFIPCHLSHTKLVLNKTREKVFLLSGNDNKIHMYREVNSLHSFREGDIEDFFPELVSMSSCALWLDVVYYANYTRRICVRGHQSGAVHVSVTDVNKLEVLQTFSVEHDSPVTYVKTFLPFNRVHKPKFLHTSTDVENKPESSHPNFYLLVLSAITPATVYRNILDFQLSCPLFLPESNRFDTVLCGSIIDIDFDGENEILIGTYGQEILAYKLNLEAVLDGKDSGAYKFRHLSGEAELSKSPAKSFEIPSRRVKSQENLSSSLNTEMEYLPGCPGMPMRKETDRCNHGDSSYNTGYSESSKNAVSNYGDCSLLWQRSFACPVIGMNKLDIMGDGMEDLAIVTLKGLHILQPDMNEVAKVCMERLRLLASDKQQEEIVGEPDTTNTDTTHTDTTNTDTTYTDTTNTDTTHTDTTNTDTTHTDTTHTDTTHTDTTNTDTTNTDTTHTDTTHTDTTHTDTPYTDTTHTDTTLTDTTNTDTTNTDTTNTDTTHTDTTHTDTTHTDTTYTDTTNTDTTNTDTTNTDTTHTDKTNTDSTHTDTTNTDTTHTDTTNTDTTNTDTTNTDTTNTDTTNTDTTNTDTTNTDTTHTDTTNTDTAETDKLDQHGDSSTEQKEHSGIEDVNPVEDISQADLSS